MKQFKMIPRIGRLFKTYFLLAAILFLTGSVYYGIDAWKYDKLKLASDVQFKQNKIKEMMLHAWSNYKKYAWGANELRPLLKTPNENSVFGDEYNGATIVDSMDTLFIMNLTKEYEDAKDWVQKHFKVSGLTSSKFEINIRFLGGFLSMYALTGDNMFKEKAVQVANSLVPLYKEDGGKPSLIVPLAEMGTFHLEFAYLSDIIGNSTYRERVENIRHLIHTMDRPDGLYKNVIYTVDDEFIVNTASLGGGADSFYEYLLKSWLQSDKQDVIGKEMFTEAMDVVIKNLIKISPGGLTYVGIRDETYFIKNMEHLACFSGGMFGLASHTLRDKRSSQYMELAKRITHTCHESYIRSKTRLGPEVFSFNGTVEAKSSIFAHRVHILRPEVIESYFILWRITHDQKYRDWAWDAVQAIEKYCRTPNGYSGIIDVYTNEVVHDDVQQSFFMAETLKYLYLIFSEDSLLSLNEWVFNTEAHPLPIKNKNKFYRAAIKLIN